ncbi:conserved hypothetical protein [Rippkaea orientalis PCC 8801]|uniref:DUF2281 domain-containing protein n=1 Tax=Rippkaea orientalis (strain PCC 8801 / RF-1) TaxID=41431 RepID=B7JVA8_RIPO1|nr:DUF2281 domain-containing protein [Rippkaea orientalis]ACK68241.1 conserved hypothetical protein [Rippkaea orientalis PCC 8801]
MTISNSQITQKIITKLQNISLEKQQKILDYIESIDDEYSSTPEKLKPSAKKRILGLHQGKIWMSQDFNDPFLW